MGSSCIRPHRGVVTERGKLGLPLPSLRGWGRGWKRGDALGRKGRTLLILIHREKQCVVPQMGVRFDAVVFYGVHPVHICG